MTTRSSVWLVAIPMLGLASCGGEFSTQTAGTDAGVGSGEGGSSAGGSRSGGSTSTGGRKTGGSTGRGGTAAAGGLVGRGGINPGTGGVYPGGTSGAGGTISSGSEAEFRASLISVYCDVFTNCCASTVSIDHTQCVTTLTSLVSQDLTSPRAGYYTFDAASGATCIETVRSSVASTCTSIPSNFACDGVYQGILKPGDPCNASVECARQPGDNISCDPGPAGPTICIRKHRVGEGQACAMTCTDLDGATSCHGSGTSTADVGRCFTNDGLYCSAGGVCLRQTDIGSICSDTDGCVAGAKCDFSVDICVPLGSAGDACSYASDCRDELHCDTANGYCAPDFAPGQPCSDASECGAGSCANGLCSSTSFGLGLLCSVLQSGITLPPPP
jgi:hypothetical protein